LDDFLRVFEALEEKNIKILKVADDGYKQSEIARYWD